MGVQLNTCVALRYSVNKINKYKQGQNSNKCDLNLHNLALSCLCCNKQFNLKV